MATSKDVTFKEMLPYAVVGAGLLGLAYYLLSPSKAVAAVPLAAPTPVEPPVKVSPMPEPPIRDQVKSAADDALKSIKNIF